MKYKIIDTHCHVQMRQYDADRDEVIKRALDSGVGIICVGVDLETSRLAIELAHRYEGLYASVGLHPNDNLDEAFDATAYELLAKDPKVVAIGEIGLDYFRTTESDKKAFQMERFKQQIKLAGKPLIIHCRDAHDDMLAVLPQGQGVIHSFTGSLNQALAYVERGYSIGFNGIITFARDYDETVRAIPADRILLETDAPYLAPQSHRGKRNEPVYILETAQVIAALRGESTETILQQTTQNAQELFKML